MDEVNHDRLPYVVDENSNPSAIREAVEGLKRMAAAGDAARAALEALERDGCHDRPVWWISSGNYPMLHISRFPRYHPVSSDDLPNMADLRLELMVGRKTRYGGHPCREYPLKLCGDIMESHKSGLVRKPIDGEVLVGTLRASSAAISWLSGRNGVAYPVTEKRKTIEAAVGRVQRCAALEPFGNYVGRHLVTKGPTGYMGQKAQDLRNAAGKWLVEQGHAARMLEHAVRMLWIEEVMEL